MVLDKRFSIQFSGLKLGKHEFEYRIESSFFDSFLLEEEDSYNVLLNVVLEFEKMSTMLVLKFNLSGCWLTDCDRCGDDLKINLNSSNTLYVKFGDEVSDSEDIITLGHNEFELNISPFIYEYILTSLPSKKTHEEEKCNQEALKRLEKLIPKEEGNNPLWDKLKDLN